MPNTFAPSEAFVRDFQQNVGFLNPKIALDSELKSYQEGFADQLGFVRDTMKLNTEAIVKLQDKADKWAGLEAKVDRIGEKLEEALETMRRDKQEAEKEKARQKEKKDKAKKEQKDFQDAVLAKLEKMDNKLTKTEDKLVALTGEVGALTGDGESLTGVVRTLAEVVGEIKRTTDDHTVQLAKLAKTTTSTNFFVQAIAAVVGVSGKTLAQGVGFLVTKTMEAYQAYFHGMPLPEDFHGQGLAPEAAQLMALQEPNALAN